MSASTDRIPVEVECDLCHGSYLMSRRGRRGRVARGDRLLCQTCRILAQLEQRPIPDPSAYYSWWEARLPDGRLDELLVDVFGAAAGSVRARRRRAGLLEAAQAETVAA